MQEIIPYTNCANKIIESLAAKMSYFNLLDCHHAHSPCIICRFINQSHHVADSISFTRFLALALTWCRVALTFMVTLSPYRQQVWCVYHQATVELM